jgi:di/tricarboxylate transporter
MADALIATGAAKAIAAATLGMLDATILERPLGAATLLALMGLLAHLVVISRTARVAVLIPAIGVPIASLGYDPAGVMFTLAVATGFCQTLPVSAKAVALYGNLAVPTYSPHDLKRLAAWLLPPHVLLIVLFALVIWPPLGIPFAR